MVSRFSRSVAVRAGRRRGARGSVERLALAAVSFVHFREKPPAAPLQRFEIGAARGHIPVLFWSSDRQRLLKAVRVAPYYQDRVLLYGMAASLGPHWEQRLSFLAQVIEPISRERWPPPIPAPDVVPP